MSSDSCTNAKISNSEAERTAPLTSAFASSPIPMSPATDSYMQTRQFLPASDSETSPIAPSGLTHQAQQIRQHPPYEPSSVEKTSEWVGEKESSQEKTSPPPLPTHFYQQTTSVPLSSTTPPMASPVRMAHSVPLPPYQRTSYVRPSPSAPLTRVYRRRTRRRVDARKWTFLLPIIRYWRSQEGAPRTRELGESSFTSSRILPVTGEPIHHTVPLLAARLVRHENRIDALASMMNDHPPENIEFLAEDVETLGISQLKLEEMMEQLNAQSTEVMEHIGLLCTAATTTGTILETMDRDLEILSIQNEILRRTLQESLDRERARDEAMESMSAMIHELQRRMDNPPGKP